MQNAKINVSENSRNGKINISFMIKVLLMILFMVTFVGQSYFYISIFCIPYILFFVIPLDLDTLDTL